MPTVTVFGNMRVASGVVAIFLCVFLFLSSGCDDPNLECRDPLGCVIIGPNDPVHVAYLLAESGTAAFLGADSKGGIEIAISDRESGLLSHQIDLSGRDTACNEQTGVEAARTLTADSTILGIIGTSCSRVAAAVMPQIDDAGLVMVSASNTDPALTNAAADWRGAYFRTVHHNLAQAEIAAEYAFTTLTARSAAVIRDNSDYSATLAQAFAAAWQEQGGDVVFQGGLPVGETDTSDMITSLVISEPDLLYLPLFQPEASLMLNSLSNVSSLDELTVIGADTLFEPSFPAGAGPAATGMIIAGTAVTGVAYDVFQAKWEVRVGGTPPATYHAHAYDAADLLLTTIETVAQESGDGTLLIGRQALRQALAAASLDGLTGDLRCTPAGDCVTVPTIGLYRIGDSVINGDRWPPPLVWTP